MVNKNKDKSNPMVELRNRIAELEGKVSQLQNKNNNLENRVKELESYQAVSHRVNSELSKEVDRLGQYTRRSNLIIRNMWLPEGEKNEQLHQKVKDVIKNDLNLSSEADDIDKLHRVGKVKENNGKKHQNIIVRFRSHSSRYSVFSQKKKLRNLKIGPNLTTTRNKLLSEAINFVDSIEEVNFVYADIHGDTKVRLKEAHNGKFVFLFNTIEELEKLLLEMNVKID